MSTDRTATLRHAGVLFRQGKLDEAIAACLSVTVSSPDDWTAARVLGELHARAGQTPEAVVQLIRAADGLLGEGHTEQARTVYQRVLGLEPHHECAKRMVAVLTAQAGVPRTGTASAEGGEAKMLRAAIEEALHRASFVEVVPLARRLLAIDRQVREDVLSWGWAAVRQAPSAGYQLVELAADAAVLEADWAYAAAALQEFVTRVPRHIAALERLVSVCAEGRLEATLGSAQAQLVEVYLEEGAAVEARRLVEELLAREPGERAHIERLTRALTIQGERNPHAVAAERFGRQGQRTSPDPRTGRSGSAADLEEWLGEDTPSEQPTSRSTSEPHLASAVPGRPEEVAGEAAPAFRSAADAYARGLDLYEAGDLAGCLLAMTMAAADPRLAFQSAALAARVYRDRGATREAIQWFDRAASQTAPDPNLRYQLLYELADLLELTDDPAQALAVCLELEAEASGYRDIAGRVERLARALARMRG